MSRAAKLVLGLVLLVVAALLFGQWAYHAGEWAGTD